jgi:hypothetical protein
MIWYECVNWYDEELDGDNDGLVYGIYTYDDIDIINVEWFSDEDVRNEVFKKEAHR